MTPEIVLALLDRLEKLERVASLGLSMRNRREFDAQIVERNDWEQFRDALDAITREEQCHTDGHGEGMVMGLIEPGDPPQEFYVGYRELFEKPQCKGYTRRKNEAGVFTLDEARSMTSRTCADGYGRWYISCSALDSFDGLHLNPMEVY